ncbi:hypothetical protein HDU82_002567, partial [Entophlyctis luteolus]
MANQVLFVTYAGNQPVKIETHYIGEQERRRPLSDVADVIAASATDTTRRLLGLPGDYGPLTLHAVVDGVEGPALEPDLLLSDLTAGRTAKSALIIKSQNDMDVDSSPTSEQSSRSSINKEVIQQDGIDINTEHLERRDLVAQLRKLVARHRFVRLTSPQASGKSSLLKLYQYSLRKTVDVVWISCLDARSCSELLLAEAGIDMAKKLTTNRAGKKLLVVFLDDAQAKFADLTFWKLLIKMSPNWLPSTVRFVIASTHLQAGGIESPAELRSLERLERKDFLLSRFESETFLELPVIGLPKSMRFPSLIQVLVNECGGLIGALRLSVDSLKRRFAKDVAAPESALLQYSLSKEYVSAMDRCFGSAHSDPIGNDFKAFLKKIFVDERVLPHKLVNPEDEQSYASLKKSGILVELGNGDFAFSSPLAKRYYFKWIFPNRSITAPTSLHELVRNVIGSMSSNLLAQSTVADDFPKETVFQHLFLNDVSGIVPDEIDFYLNGELRWGIEVLICRDGVGEHLSRFAPTGKYFQLGVTDYAV